MYHFFTETEFFTESEAVITGPDVNHIKNVLRMKPGEKILLSDGKGTNCLCEITELFPDKVLAKILPEEVDDTELPVKVTLYQGLPKADKMEFIIQKCVELGVTKIVPVDTDRAVGKLDAKKEEAKRKRWYGISESAAKQSKRMIVPEIGNVMKFKAAIEAAALDDRIIAAWTGHPHLRVIDNATDFEDKLKRLIAEISAFLGEPEPLEIERKYLIEYPDMKWLTSLPNCRKVEIIQTYLTSAAGEETRVRQRGADGHYVYYLTTKRTVSELKRVEIERRLSEREYVRLLMDADPTRRPIRKDRYCLTYDNQYFEIDVYPFWDDRAIVEIELRDEDQTVRFPEKLRLIREVTDDAAYKNAALARI